MLPCMCACKLLPQSGIVVENNQLIKQIGVCANHERNMQEPYVSLLGQEIEIVCDCKDSAFLWNGQKKSLCSYSKV